MKQVLTILLLCLTICQATAQRISRTYQDLSLSEVLKDLNAASSRYEVSFIYNELEDFRVTTTLHRSILPNAVRQVVGFYPMRVTETDSVITVECIHKTDLHLTGTIIDEQGQPVAYANIAVLNPADSTLLCGGVSNESGVFVIPIDQTNILTRISYVGYKTVYKQCDNTELGTIRMQTETQTLKGVTVKGAKRLVYSTDKGLVANVQGTVLEQFGSVSDMLTHLPLVMSDGSVAGRGKPEIYINNKKVRDESELERLRVDEILSAEIITNPGAEYGAEVSSVIRLKTVRKAGEGWSGNFAGTTKRFTMRKSESFNIELMSWNTITTR